MSERRIGTGGISTDNGQPRERISRPEKLVPFEKLFDIVYGEVNPVVKALALKNIQNFVVFLEKEGCEARWTGSGPTLLAMKMVQGATEELGINIGQVLGSKTKDYERNFLGFSPVMQDRSDIVRNQFLLLQQELSGLTPEEVQELNLHEETKEILKTATPTADLDITVIKKQTQERADFDINEKPGQIFSRIMLPHLMNTQNYDSKGEGNGIFQNGKQKGFRATIPPRITKGSRISVTAQTGPLLMAPDRHYLGISYQDDKNALFDMHLATAPTTLVEDDSEYRLSSLVMSNERTTLPIKIVENQMCVDIYKLRTVAEHMTNTLSFGRTSTGVPIKTVESAKRGARKLIAVYPRLNDLTQATEALYEKETVASIQVASEKVRQNPKLLEESRNRITLLREIMVMFSHDPHLAASILLQTGLWKISLSDQDPSLLYQFMLEDGMTATTAASPDRISSSELLRADLRNMTSVTQSRDYYMEKGGANGLRLTHNAFYKLNNPRRELVNLSEFNEIVGVFTGKAAENFIDNKFPPDYVRKIQTAISNLGKRNVCNLNAQYINELINNFNDMSPIYGKNPLHNPEFNRDLQNGIKVAWDILNEYKAKGTTIIEKADLLAKLEAKNIRKDIMLEADTILEHLWTLGILTRWGAETFIQTPKGRLDRILDTKSTDQWKVNLTTEQYNTVRLMLLDKVRHVVKDVYWTKTCPNRKRNALKAALQLVDKKMPSKCMNIMSAFAALPDGSDDVSRDVIYNLIRRVHLKETDYPDGYLDGLMQILDEEIRPLYGKLYIKDSKEE